ncbi:MAG: hypothetical protein VYD19_05530, partial [Myxococcota bacterium]|nr:hypothetical protein [Myxococcota bacterium]
MSTQQSNLADRLALFESEWLQTIVAKDQSQLPPPLPNQLGGTDLGEGLPSTLEGPGAQLADLYFERLSETANELESQGRGVAQIGLHLERYLGYCRAQLGRLFDALDAKERPLITLAPYLLNCNIPGLAGYQKPAETPRGVADFDFNSTVMRAVEQIFGHRKRPDAPNEASVLSLFCESSLGQARYCGAGPRQITLWALVRPHLARRDEFALLLDKCRDIIDWMGSRGISLSFKLVDAGSLEVQTPEGELEETAPALVREHLYRRTFLLAGMVPLWWIAPSAIQSDSYDRLRKAIMMNQIEGLEFLDIGALSMPTQSELLTEGLRAVRGALHHPFENILRLAMSISRLEGVPFQLPCERLKQSVFAGRYELEHVEQSLIESDLLHRFFESVGERYENRTL